MKRFSWCLALSFVTATLGGCAVDASPSGHAIVATSTTSEALTGSADDVFPVLAPASSEHVTRDQVCTADRAQAKAAWLAWLARTGKQQGHWVYGDGKPNRFTCKACDLEGQELAVAGVTYEIEDSFMAGAAFGPRYGIMDPPATFELRNVFAYDSDVSVGTRLAVNNVDLRCGRISQDVVIHDSSSLDVSGTRPEGLLTIASSRDVRISAIVPTARVALQDIDGARLQSDVPFMLRGTMTGAWFFDGSQQLDLHASGALTFDHATLSFAGASGQVALDGSTVTMNGGAVVGLEGKVRVVDVTKGSLHVNDKATWPVGVTSLVGDASLTAVDLTGAILVKPKGETWPTPFADLRQLRLSHGTLPDGSDLSTVNLSEAHLDQVDLRSTTISKTLDGKTVSTDFTGAHLARAKLEQLAIDGVRFVRADLRGADLAEIHGKADFSFATAGVLPAHTDGNDTDNAVVTSFKRARLEDSKLSGTQIQGTSFGLAHLADVAFDELTDATDADFAGAFFTRTTDAGVLLPNTSFGRVGRLHGVKLDAADLRTVDLQGVDLRPSETGRSSLVGTFLCGADLTGAKLGGSELTGAFADVAGNVTLPTEGDVACPAAIRIRVDTTPANGAATDCPTGGSGRTAGCSDAQWKVQGHLPPPTCTNPGNTMSGFPCKLDCECQSYQCGPDGKCT